MINQLQDDVFLLERYCLLIISNELMRAWNGALAQWWGQNWIWWPRTRFSKLFGLQVLKSNQSWVLQRVPIGRTLICGSDLQLGEIEEAFLMLMSWAFWQTYLLTIAASEIGHQNLLFPWSDPFLNSSIPQMLPAFVSGALFVAAVCHRGRGESAASTSTGGWDAEGEDWTAEPTGRGEEVKWERMVVGEVKAWGGWSS